MTGLGIRAGAALVPWAGWIAGGLGWFGAQQLGSNFVQLDCAAADPWKMVLIGLGAALLVVTGGLISFRHWRHSHADTSRDFAGASRFLALVSSMAAALFLGAILFQTASSLIVPQCHG